MKAARIHEFGSPEVIRIADVPQPTPNEGQILVRVAAAGVGPWDPLLRERKASSFLIDPFLSADPSWGQRVEWLPCRQELDTGM